jgi:hypothetical protein
MVSSHVLFAPPSYGQFTCAVCTTVIWSVHMCCLHHRRMVSSHVLFALPTYGQFTSAVCTAVIWSVHMCCLHRRHMVSSHVLFAPPSYGQFTCAICTFSRCECVTNLHCGTNRPQHGYPNVRLEILACCVQLTGYEKIPKMEANAYSAIAIYVRYGRHYIVTAVTI